MDIVDKRVVVTGAASGIGKALAVEFKNEKANDVVLADLNDEVVKVAEELGFSCFVLSHRILPYRISAYLILHYRLLFYLI